MDKIFYIALYLMGFESKELIDIMLKVPRDDLKYIFTENNLSVQFKYNVSLGKVELLDKELVERKIKEAKLIVKNSKELGIKIVTYNSKYYPKLLKLIIVKGSYITRKDEKSIGCVGSRRTSSFGESAVNVLVSALAKEEFTIVSGLATGIDTYCHKTCLNNKGKTIAVLAHGLDQIYPKENEGLAERILSNGGCLISEYPVGSKIEKYKFVKRNRIIAGLSKAVILFESKEKSGSMHTVNYAIEYNRKVFCPQPNFNNESTSGLSYLINNKKAIPLKNKKDFKIVIKELGYKLNSNLEQTQNVKNEAFNKFINVNSNTNNIFKDIKSLECDKYSGIKTNRETYEIFKNILSENDLSIREFFNAIIVTVVNSYNGGSKNE